MLAAGASFAAVWWQERARDNARARAQALFQGARVDFTDFTPSRPRDAYNKTMEALRILDDNKIPVHELEPELKGLMRAGREGLKDYKEKGDNIKDGTQMFVEVLKRYETFAEPDETFELNSYVGALLLQDSISRTTRMTDELVQAEQNSYRAIEFGDQKTRLRRNLYLQAGMTLSAIADVEYDEALASDTEAKVRSRMGHAEKLAFDAIACFERCKLDIVTDRIFSSAMFRLAMAQQAQGKFAEAETHVSAALGYRNYSDLAQPLILCQRKIDLAEMYVKEEKWDKAELLLASVFEQWEKHPDLVRNPISMIENYIRAEDGLGHKKRSDELHVITRRLKSKLQREILAE